MIGKKKYYFVPDLNADELKLRESYVLAIEFDNTDNTFKVRFLNGDAVQQWAVGDTPEAIQRAYDKFQEYRKVWHECDKACEPIMDRLRETYARLYGDYMDVSFGDMIKAMHNVRAVADAAEAKEKAESEDKAEVEDKEVSNDNEKNKE